MSVLRFASTDQPGRNGLLALVKAKTGQDVLACYQCGKCSAGCPLSSAMDLAPHQVLRAVQLGQRDLVFQSSAIWLCVTCQTCYTRCPQEVDLPKVMDALRSQALQEKIRPAERTVKVFHDAFLSLVERFGRLYEVGLIGSYNLLARQPLASADLGLPMLTRGKLELIPRRVKDREQIKAIFKRAAELELEEITGQSVAAAPPASVPS